MSAGLDSVGTAILRASAAQKLRAAAGQMDAAARALFELSYCTESKPEGACALQLAANATRVRQWADNLEAES